MPETAAVLEKAENYASEKGSQLGGAMESANEKAADFKTQVEEGYAETVSPAIDSAQVNFAGASRYLQENTARDYVRDLEEFAKQHPRITAGVCAFLGWKIGRALKFSK